MHDVDGIEQRLIGLSNGIIRCERRTCEPANVEGEPEELAACRTGDAWCVDVDADVYDLHLLRCWCLSDLDGLKYYACHRLLY